MQTEIIESMHEQVRAIHRALTGDDVPETTGEPADAPATDEAVTRRFAELAVLARQLPGVPPFTFTPPIDVLAGDAMVILELAIPGIDRDDVTVERTPEALIVRGIRRDPHDQSVPTPSGRGTETPDRDHQALFYAEIPRGPFLRVIPLAIEIVGEPRVELERGILRVQLAIAKP